MSTRLQKKNPEPCRALISRDGQEEAGQLTYKNFAFTKSLNFAVHVKISMFLPHLRSMFVF